MVTRAAHAFCVVLAGLVRAVYYHPSGSRDEYLLSRFPVYPPDPKNGLDLLHLNFEVFKSFAVGGK